MPDIVDSLVVSLGLDPTQYNREIKKYRDDRKRLAEDDAKYNQSQEKAQKSQIEGMRTLRNETAGFVLALAGANSLKSFAANIITGDAATGRFASNLGMATEKVAAWELAVRKAGGSEGGGRGLLSQMSGVIQNINQTGDRQTGALLSALGLKSLPQDPQELLFQLAGQAGNMSPQRYRSLLGQLGIDDAGVTLLSKGTEGLRAYIREQERMADVSKENTDNAIAFENAMTDIETAIKSAARPAVEGLAGEIADLAKNQDAVNTAANIGIGIMGALAVATVAATWPWIALAGAIAGAVAAYRSWQHRGDQTTGEWAAGGLRFGAQWAADKLGIVTANGGEGRLAFYNRGRDAMGNPIGGGTAGGDGSLAGFSMGGAPARVPRGQPAVALHGNNPGGINDSAWASHQPGYVGNNGRYAAFATMADGIAAQKALLASYVNRGYNTPAKIANRWAPAADRNNPTAYAANIARQMGIGVNDMIGPAQLNAFQHAQAITENSRYGRPGMMASRGVRGGGGSVTNNVTVGEIRINTSSKDAEGIARDMRGELAKRGLVTQANTGLTG